MFVVCLQHTRSRGRLGRGQVDQHAEMRKLRFECTNCESRLNYNGLSPSGVASMTRPCQVWPGARRETGLRRRSRGSGGRGRVRIFAKRIRPWGEGCCERDFKDQRLAFRTRFAAAGGCSSGLSAKVLQWRAKRTGQTRKGCPLRNRRFNWTDETGGTFAIRLLR